MGRGWGGSYIWAWTKGSDRAVCDRAGGHKELVASVGAEHCCCELCHHRVPAG